MKGIFPLFIGLFVLVQETFVLLSLPKSARKFFSLTVHYLTSFVPIAQQTGQAVVPGRLYLIMCL